MTAITRTVAVLENLANKTLTNEQMINVVENCINYRPDQNLTNEQKAERFLTLFKQRVVMQAKAGARTKANEDNMAAAQAAEDAAVVDMV